MGMQHNRNFDDKLKHARDTAHQEPKLIAELIKEWMGGGT
jgi:flagellar biosynthesis/type III secretory pathway M-ring protein FliF/YscJ